LIAAQRYRLQKLGIQDAQLFMVDFLPMLAASAL